MKKPYMDDSWLAAVVMAILLTSMGAFFTYLLGKEHTLTCTHRDGATPCAIHITWMGLVDLSVQPLDGLRSASVEENCDEDCTYRVLLETRGGMIPFPAVYSSGSVDKTKTAEQINQFMANAEQPTLQVKTGGGFFVLIPAAFMAVGLFFAAQVLVTLLRSLRYPEE